MPLFSVSAQFVVALKQARKKKTASARTAFLTAPLGKDLSS